VKVLVVEDEKDLADAIARGLARQAYSVDVAYDGDRALESLEINSYDLLILDLNLPGVDGLEICRRVRSTNSSIGILMLTARASQDSRVLGLELPRTIFLASSIGFSGSTNRASGSEAAAGWVWRLSKKLSKTIEAQFL
jgi:DNA-binding response OmpR family regulator